MTQSPQNTSLTFAEMRTAVRRELALSPVGTLSSTDSERVNRVVTEALTEYVAARHDWSWLSQSMTITLTPGTGTYILPWYYSALTQIVYAASSDSPCLSIKLVDPATMDRLCRDTTASGDPVYATVDPGPESGRWSIRLWPTPSSVRTMTVRFRASVRRPANDDDSFFAGPAYDAMILAACRYAARVDRRIEEPRDAERYARAMSDAIAIDDQARPRLVGTLGINGDDGYQQSSNRPLYYNDQLIV